MCSLLFGFDAVLIQAARKAVSVSRKIQFLNQASKYLYYSHPHKQQAGLYAWVSAELRSAAVKMVFVKEENTSEPESWRIKQEEPEPRRIKQEEPEPQRIKHKEPETCRIKYEEPETWRIKYEEPETWRIKHEEQGGWSFFLIHL